MLQHCRRFFTRWRSTGNALSFLDVRRSVCLVLLVSYLCTVVGFPVPEPAPRHDKRPYPCQGHACGCPSAEYCWSACRCFTREEKLAWARKQRVEPPVFVLAQAASADGVTDRSEPCAAPEAAKTSTSKPHACCQSAGRSESRPSESVSPDEVISGQCCASKSSATTREASGTRVCWVIGIEALRCRGLGSHWLTYGDPVAPPPPPVSWEFSDGVIGAVPDVSIDLSSRSICPPTPPG